MNDKDTIDGRIASEPAADSGLSTLNRRRALLKGLGKGSALLAAAAPIQSFANEMATKSGGNAPKCTVSGQYSVMHSVANAPVCGCYHPRHYMNCTNVSIKTCKSSNNSNDRKLGNFLSGCGQGYYTYTDPLTLEKCVYNRPTSSSDSCVKIAKVNWPTSLPTLDGHSTCQTIFGSRTTTTTTILQACHSDSDDAYHVAAYFCAKDYGGSSGSPKVPFEDSHVLDNYSPSPVTDYPAMTKKAAATNLYRQICNQS